MKRKRTEEKKNGRAHRNQVSADIFNNYAVKEKQTQRGARGTLHTLAPVANIPRSDKKRGRDREREGGRGEREWGEPRATNHKKK